jgi:hypothetical protein
MIINPDNSSSCFFIELIGEFLIIFIKTEMRRMKGKCGIK